jgi:hypothetical protein
MEWDYVLKSGHQVPIVYPPDNMGMEICGERILTEENRRTWRKTCPSNSLPNTNPTWTDRGMNPGFHGERPATNPLSYGTV